MGKLLELNADRVQKYENDENGARKPKAENGEKIADVLRVSRMSTTDPDTMSCLGTMYALFEIEKIFGMQIEEKIKEYH